MHHGLPCVVSDQVGCAPDLVEEGRTGELFEAGSASSLRQAIERAMRLVGREDVRARCQEKVSGYTVERAAEGLARAFRDVVERAERRT
jgi:glycosyltransferase involved in cell wall biosynthesis